MTSRKKKILVLLVFAIITNYMIIKKVQIVNNNNFNLLIQVKSSIKDEYQVFYSINGEDFSEENSQKQNYTKINEEQVLKFAIPETVKYIRIDPGTTKCKISIGRISAKKLLFEKKLDLKDLDAKTQSAKTLVKVFNNSLEIQSNEEDPKFVFEFDGSILDDLNSHISRLNFTLKIVFCFVIDVLLAVLIRKSKSVLQLATELNNNKSLIWSLAKNDFKTKYAGSYLGIIWAFINPVVTILIYWFVFGYGLKAGSPVKDASFIYWFMSGLIPWFFFQDALLNATNCMLEYSYLVKKVVFKISILPIIKIISAVFVHLVFICFLIFVGIVQGRYPNLMVIQLAYYSFCTFFLVLGLSYMTSSVVLFFKDLSQFIGIFLQIGMWMTPIMWSYTIIPENYQWIAKINPMYYIVEGYRDTLINRVWLWDRYFQTVYFWAFSLVVFIVGAIVFKKLKPHFSDVL